MVRLASHSASPLMHVIVARDRRLETDLPACASPHAQCMARTTHRVPAIDSIFLSHASDPFILRPEIFTAGYSPGQHPICSTNALLKALKLL
jgi:hypothetical protein